MSRKTNLKLSDDPSKGPRYLCRGCNSTLVTYKGNTCIFCRRGMK